MDREKLTEEILAYLDGQLSAAEERALAARIRGDAEVEKLFSDLMRLHGSVATVLTELSSQKAAEREIGGAATPPGGVARVRRHAPRPETRRAVSPGSATVWILTLAGAAAAILLIAFLASGPSARPPERPEAARPARAPLAAPETVPEPPKPPPPKDSEKAPEPQKPRPERPPAGEDVPPKPPPSRPEPVPGPPVTPTRPEAVPAPAPKPPAEPRTVVAVAKIERLKGEVSAVAPGGRAAAAEGQPLLAGTGLEIGRESVAVVAYEDGTRLNLGPDTTAEFLASSKAAPGKRVVLKQGQLAAQVAKQPAGQTMVFVTPHAEARVLGTSLKLTVDAGGSRLEVKEGRVRFTRLPDGAFTDVSAEQYAAAAPGTRPVAKRIGAPATGKVFLLEEFEDPSAVKARWQPLEGGFPATTSGALEVDLSPRPGDSYAEGGWHAPGGLRTKQSFPLPLRVTVDVEVSHKDAAVNTFVLFVPKSQRAGALKNEVAVRVRGEQYALLVEGQHVKETDIAWKPPLRERWTLELDRAEVRFLADGKEIHRHTHGLQVTEDYRIELHVAAKLEAPKGARVRFDKVRIEP